MKIGLKKFVASLLAVAFLWSTLAMMRAQAGIVDALGYRAAVVAEMPAMDGTHRIVSEMGMPVTADMHCDKAGSAGHDCGSHCNLCCASVVQYRFFETAYSPCLMRTPVFFVAGIVIPTQDRPPRSTLA